MYLFICSNIFWPGLSATTFLSHIFNLFNFYVAFCLFFGLTDIAIKRDLYQLK